MFFTLIVARSSENKRPRPLLLPDSVKAAGNFGKCHFDGIGYARSTLGLAVRREQTPTLAALMVEEF